MVSSFWTDDKWRGNRGMRLDLLVLRHNIYFHFPISLVSHFFNWYGARYTPMTRSQSGLDPLISLKVDLLSNVNWPDKKLYGFPLKFFVFPSFYNLSNKLSRNHSFLDTWKMSVRWSWLDTLFGQWLWFAKRGFVNHDIKFYFSTFLRVLCNSPCSSTKGKFNCLL